MSDGKSFPPSKRAIARLAAVSAIALFGVLPFGLAEGGFLRGDSAGDKMENALSGIDYSHAVLDEAMLTSGFGERVDPFTAKRRFHDGVDLVEARGSPVYAPADGKIVFAGIQNGYGNTIEVAVSDTKRLRFAHLRDILVEEGTEVEAGQVIGKVGNSGRTQTNHVHLEVLNGDIQSDPEDEAGLIFANELRRREGAEIRVSVEVKRPQIPES